MSNVKGNCIWVLTIVGVLLISIATGFLLLTAGYLIPSEALHDHLMKSAALLSEEKTYPKEAYSRRRLDNFTDSLMLLTSSNNTYDSPFENAVRIQIYAAIITYCTVAIIEKDLNLERSVFDVLRILGSSLLVKDNMMELLSTAPQPISECAPFNQLSLNFG